MLIKLLIFYIIYCKHYKFGEEPIKNDDLKIYPYLFLKNNYRTNILFWDNYNEEDKKIFFKLKCQKITKTIYRTKNEIFLDNFYYKIKENFLNKLEFDSKKLNLNIHGKKITINFECNLKYLVFIYLGKNMSNKTYISNFQISDTNENNEILNYMDPLVFVDFNQENLNTKFFKNKFNSYHGGINGKINEKYSNLYSYYDLNSNVKWIIQRANQFIKLDENILLNINRQIEKTFTFYINFDSILNIKNYKKNEQINFILYSIESEKNNLININLKLLKSNDRFFLTISDLSKRETFFYKNSFIKNISKIDLGIKFFVFSHYSKFKNKYLLGLKKNSIFVKNNKLLEKKISGNLLDLNFERNYSKFKHSIGKENFYKKDLNNQAFEFFIILNEYGIFSGTDFNFEEIVNNEIFLKIDGNNKLLITNNNNLERKFNLYNNKKTSKCSTFKCSLCDLNDICLFCYYNYYLDSKNNCILNNDSDKFVNEFSELMVKDNELNENDFKTKSNKKEIDSINLLNYFRDLNVILYFNIYIKSLKNDNYSNLILNDPLKYNYNLYFNQKIKANNVPFNIQIYDNNININKLEFEIRDNNNYQIEVKNYKRKINCNNLENEIFYENIYCSNICNQNKIKYYYKPINYKKGYCVKTIDKGYFLDNNNIILKCKNNCSDCNFDNINNKYVCKKCIKGYKLINNNCFFNNEFNCGNNNNLDQIFDNTNKDGIIICNEFCNLCRSRGGILCSIIDFENKFCKINNIKLIKYNESFIKNNLKKCEKLINNKCVKCKENYFLNENSYCEECLKNCNKCNNNLNCNICSKGYYLKNKICLSCNLKFNNCSECNNEKCFIFKNIEIKKNFNCFIDKCSKCKKDNICEKCNKNYKLENNKCKNKNNYYFKKFYCIKDSINICPKCLKCKTHKIFFNQFQNKNEIIINYNKNLINIHKNPSFFKIWNSKAYIILFKNNNIIVRIFDKSFINVSIIIKKSIIKNLKEGYFNGQIIRLKNIVLNNNISKYKKIEVNENKSFKFIAFIMKNKIIKNSIKYTYNLIGYSRFLIIFLPFIININQSTLFILLKTKLNTNFLNLLKIIKKINLPWIKNENIIKSKDFKKSYLIIKKKFKNNIIIGDMNLIDIDILIIFSLFLFYYIFNFYIKKISNKRKWLIFFKNNVIYLKLFGFTIFQSYLIKYYYKIIFFIEIFFNLNDYIIKFYLFLWIQFYIIIILFYLNYNFYYCQLFKRLQKKIKTNFNEKVLTKLFVPFKNKYTRYSNLIFNLLDFIIVIIFMKLNNFYIQIISWKIIVFLKIFYLIKLHFKYFKFLITTYIISNTLLFIFYMFLLFRNINYDKRQSSNWIIILFLSINIWDIWSILFYNLFKKIKKRFKNNTIKLKRIFKWSNIKTNPPKNFNEKTK